MASTAETSEDKSGKKKSELWKNATFSEKKWNADVFCYTVIRTEGHVDFNRNISWHNLFISQELPYGAVYNVLEKAMPGNIFTSFFAQQSLICSEYLKFEK